jgi:hypothetical protein
VAGPPALTCLIVCRHVTHKGAVDAGQVAEFVDGIRTGSRGAVPLVGDLATIATVEPWDGKDGKIEEVEEFSLDDIMGDEL